jgi:hypothetical protein
VAGEAATTAGVEPVSGDRSTGGGSSVAVVDLPERATPERGLPTKEVVYVFRFPASDEMKAADAKETRHLVMWKAIFRSSEARYRSEFDRLAHGELEGFTEQIPPGAKHVTYRMPRRLFLRVATESALVPEAVTDADGREVPAPAEQLVITAMGSYQSSLDRMSAPRREILRQRVASALEGLRDEAPGSAIATEAFLVAQQIADKMERIDDQALQTLVQRDPFERVDTVQIAYSPTAALRHLQRFDRTLDSLLYATGHRHGMATARAESLTGAISALDGFGPAWTIRMRIEEFRRIHPYFFPKDDDYVREVIKYTDETGHPVVGVGELDRELLGLREAFRDALRRAGADPSYPEADFDRRIADFHRTLGRSLAPVALEALADLVVRVDDAIQRSYPHFRALFHELTRLVPDAKPISEEGMKKLMPELDLLAADYAVLGYPPLAKSALAAHQEFTKPRYRSSTERPEQRFAQSMNSDLVRTWRPRALRAQEILRDEPEKAWLADQLVARVLNDAGVPKEHFLREVAARKSQDVANDLSVLDTILLVVSVALMFLPGGGALGLLLRAGFMGADAMSIRDQYQHQLAAESLAGTGLASDAPSGWWLVLSVVSLGFDVADAARLLKVKPATLMEAIEKDTVDALARQARIERRDLAKWYLKERRAELLERYWPAQAKVGAALGMGPAVAEGFTEWAQLAIRLGYNGFEEFRAVTRMLFDADVPEGVLRRAFKRAKAEFSDPPDGFRIDELLEAVQSYGGLKARVDELTIELDRRVAAIDDALDRGDGAAVRSAERAHRTVNKKLQAARRRLGRAEQLQTVLDARIAQLEAMSSGLTAFSNALIGQSMNRRRQILDLVEKRSTNVRERLATLRRVKGGLALEPWQRHRFHEDVVSSALREKGFHRVKDQVTIEISYRDGGSDIVIVDNLAETKPGSFRVYDAKWSDDFDAAVGSGRKALTTEEQRRVYTRLTEGRVAGARIVHGEDAAHFGLTTEVKIALEPIVVLVLNQRNGHLRWLPLK